MTQVKLRMWSSYFLLLFSLTLFVDGDFFDIVDFCVRLPFLILEAFMYTHPSTLTATLVRTRRGYFLRRIKGFPREVCFLDYYTL